MWGGGGGEAGDGKGGWGYGTGCGLQRGQKSEQTVSSQDDAVRVVKSASMGQVGVVLTAVAALLVAASSEFLENVRLNEALRS